MNYQLPKINYSDVPHAKGANARDINRFERRVENIFARYDDRIKGCSVLDLACNTGRLSYPILMLGAESVTGVEARQVLIDEGEKIFAASPFAEQMRFEQADLFDYLTNMQPGEVDVIVCAGFLYHTVRQAEFFREVGRIRPKTLFIDTSVTKNYFWFGRKLFGKPPALFMSTEDPSKTSDTIDLDGIVYWPSTSYLEAMMAGIGYKYERVNFRKDGSRDWSGMPDYKRGTRAAYIGRRIE